MRQAAKQLLHDVGIGVKEKSLLTEAFLMVMGVSSAFVLAVHNAF